MDPITQPPPGYGKVSMDTVCTDIIVDETSKSVPLVDDEAEEHGKEVNDQAIGVEAEPILIEHLARNPEAIEELKLTQELVSIQEPKALQEIKVIDELEPILVTKAIEELEPIQEPKAIDELETIQEPKAIDELESIQEPKAKERIIQNPKMRLESIQEPKAIDELESIQEPKAIEELESIQEPKAIDELESIQEPKAIEELEPIQEPKAIEELKPIQELEAIEELEPIQEPEAIQEPVMVEAEAMEELTWKNEKVLVEYEAQNELELQEEKSLVLKTLTATSTSAPIWTFVAEKVTFSVGVAFFNISGFNPEEEEVHLIKRYSEFKVLHAEMAKLMPKEELIRLPGTSFLQGRNDKALLQEREDAFVKMLNAIAQHPEGSQTAAFTAFLA
ncbi:unnamed protein product [Peronospora belbahrii]|uniref:PX domain-containing protein n=1 Tax=Peronospora belbahrii TaxID=622444 RepID=A0ABN8DD32_9STRA|nr:unnamed protein product [Peronospora belbahrii]